MTAHAHPHFRTAVSHHKAQLEPTSEIVDLTGYVANLPALPAIRKREEQESSLCSRVTIRAVRLPGLLTLWLDSQISAWGGSSHNISPATPRNSPLGPQACSEQYGKWCCSKCHACLRVVVTTHRGNMQIQDWIIMQQDDFQSPHHTGISVGLAGKDNEVSWP